MTRLLALLTFSLLTLAFGLGCGGPEIGSACEEDADCDTGQVCDTRSPDGYCTRPCSLLGGTNECPAETVCANHGERLLCSQTCEGDGDCRDAYQCAAVPNSEANACRP